MFKRWIEKLIRQDLTQNRSVLLVGSRRVGKTTLAKMIGVENSTYHTFDDIDLQSAIKLSPKYLEQICDQRKVNILDEVQKAPDLLDTVKLLIDRGYSFILTGSSALHLLENVSETLAGRIRIRYLPPCAWGEASNPKADDKKESVITNNSMEAWDPLLFQHAKSDINVFLEYGGFPELVGKSHQEKKDILRDYRNTYLQRDILELTNIQDVGAFQGLVAALAQSIGSTVNIQHLARESGLSHVTAKKYLHALEQTFIIFKLMPYHFGPAKRFLKSSKYYFADIGMLNALNVRIHEGQLFENFVIAEVKKRLIINNQDHDAMFFYKSAKGAEIDLLVEKDDELLLYEIKRSKSISGKFSRNIKKFEATPLKPYSNLQKFIIYQGEAFAEDDGVKYIPIQSWYGLL
ncbi:MAG: ATP-binding protein [bacterium]|nr:ATP-binding protein [bacterium]